MKLNWTAIIFWIAIISGLALAYMFKDQLLTLLTGLTGGTEGMNILGFDVGSGVEGVTEYLQTNPIAAVGLAIGIVSPAIAVYERIGKVRSDSHARDEEYKRLQSEILSNTEITEIKAKVEGYEAQVEELQTKLNDDTLHSSLQEAQTIISQKNQELKSKLETINYQTELIKQLKLETVKVIS